MSIVVINRGYLEDEYLAAPYVYLTGSDGYMGMQAQAIIQKENEVGVQVEAQIIDFPGAKGAQTELTIETQDDYGLQVEANIQDETYLGLQAENNIVDSEGYLGAQTELTIEAQDEYGLQIEAIIQDEAYLGLQVLNNIDNNFYLGTQTEANIVDEQNAQGMQVGLVNENYIEYGLQTNNIIQANPGYGVQVESQIIDYTQTWGVEASLTDALSHITHEKYLSEDYLTESYLAGKACVFIGMQVEGIGQVQYEYGFQVESFINDELPLGLQSTGIIEKQNAYGFQADSVQSFVLGMQAFIAIYNTTRLRVLCEFTSRGIVDANWVTNSQASGDYDVNNVNTDIVEQAYRSAGVSAITLDSDSGIPQGVTIDTIAILNHNITSSGTVSVLQSNDPTFAVVGNSYNMEITDNNMYYIAPILPTTTYRYTRFLINDVTNPDGYIQIG